jgi:hypothetical protein
LYQDAGKKISFSSGFTTYQGAGNRVSLSSGNITCIKVQGKKVSLSSGFTTYIKVQGTGFHCHQVSLLISRCRKQGFIIIR